jgi:hypothetical protein
MGLGRLASCVHPKNGSRHGEPWKHDGLFFSSDALAEGEVHAYGSLLERVNVLVSDEVVVWLRAVGMLLMPGRREDELGEHFEVWYSRRPIDE